MIYMELVIVPKDHIVLNLSLQKKLLLEDIRCECVIYLILKEQYLFSDVKNMKYNHIDFFKFLSFSIPSLYY